MKPSITPRPQRSSLRRGCAALACAGSTAWAATLHVPGDHATIQAAINAASAGDTIEVAAGTYNEQVQVTKTLNLRGAQADVDARTRALPPGSESVIDHASGPVQILADNVVINGFTVQGSTAGDPGFISGIWTNPGYSGTQGGHQILNNIIQDNISGIELDSTCVYPTLVQHNLIRNNNQPGPGSGNGISVNFGLCNATIDANRFEGHSNSSVFVGSGGGGDQQVTVSNNEMAGGTPERILFGGVTGGIISSNVCVGSTSSGTIRLYGGNSGIAVVGNTLKDGQRGIRIDNLTTPNAAITVHGNCLSGNSIAGLEVEATGHSGPLDAEENWWGTASGPTHAGNPGGAGDGVVDPDGVVDYAPWLVCGCGLPNTDTDGDGTPDCVDACPTHPANPPGCSTTRTECDAYLRLEKKGFDDQQKAARTAFNATHPTGAQRKAFEGRQRDERQAFEDRQRAERTQCRALPRA